MLPQSGEAGAQQTKPNTRNSQEQGPQGTESTGVQGFILKMGLRGLGYTQLQAVLIHQDLPIPQSWDAYNPCDPGHKHPTLPTPHSHPQQVQTSHCTVVFSHPSRRDGTGHLQLHMTKEHSGKCLETLGSPQQPPSKPQYQQPFLAVHPSCWLHTCFPGLDLGLPSLRGWLRSLAFLCSFPKGHCCIYCAFFSFSSLFYEDYFMTRDFFFAVCSSPTSSGPYVYENFPESLGASTDLPAGPPQSRPAPFKSPWMKRPIPCNDVCFSPYSLLLLPTLKSHEGSHPVQSQSTKCSVPVIQDGLGPRSPMRGQTVGSGGLHLYCLFLLSCSVNQN